MNYHRGPVDIDGLPFPVTKVQLPALIEPPRVILPAIRDESQGDGVAKPRKEEPRIRAVKTLNGFSPATPFDQELMAEVGFGREVELTVHQERSEIHHRKYWAVLKVCVDNSENKYLRPTDLHEALKIALGVTRRIQLLTPSAHATVATKVKNRLAGVVMWVGGLLAGVPFLEKAITALNESIAELGKLEQDCDTILLPGSTGFWAMDQVAFKTYFDAAMNQLRQAGYPVDDALEYTGKQIGTKLRPVSQGGNNEAGTAKLETQRAIASDDNAADDRAFQDGGAQADSPF